MASADFSQFVVTTVNETACETSPVKVVPFPPPHAPAAFTRTSSNFWTSVHFATLSVFPSLVCGFCPSGQRFAYSFFQVPSHGGHPCCSAMCFVIAYAHSGLSPVRERPCWANKNTDAGITLCIRIFCLIFILDIWLYIFVLFSSKCLQNCLEDNLCTFARNRHANLFSYLLLRTFENIIIWECLQSSSFTVC